MDARLLSVDPRATRSLFIGDLSFFTSEKDLLDLFLKFGPLMGVEIKRGKNGESLLYGFVEYESKMVASQAMLAMNSFYFKGRKMRLNWTNMKASNVPGSESWVPVHVQFSTTDVVAQVSEEFLAPIFSSFGLLADIMVKRHCLDEGKSKLSGNAVAYFFDQQSANSALGAVKDIIVNQVKLRCSSSSFDSLKQKMIILRDNDSKLQSLPSGQSLNSQMSASSSPHHRKQLYPEERMSINNVQVPSNNAARNNLSTVLSQKQENRYHHHCSEQRLIDMIASQRCIRDTLQQKQFSYHRGVTPESPPCAVTKLSEDSSYASSNNMLEGIRPVKSQYIPLEAMKYFHRKGNHASLETATKIATSETKFRTKEFNQNNYREPLRFLQEQDHDLCKPQLGFHDDIFQKLDYNSNGRINQVSHLNVPEWKSFNLNSNQMIFDETSISQSSRSDLSSFSSGSRLSSYSDASSSSSLLLSRHQFDNDYFGDNNNDIKQKNSEMFSNLSWNIAGNQQPSDPSLFVSSIKFLNH